MAISYNVKCNYTRSSSAAHTHMACVKSDGWSSTLYARWL